MSNSEYSQVIKVSIQQWPERGPNTWAYSVSIDKAVHKIGAAHSYDAAAKLAKSGVRSAKKYLMSLVEEEMKANESL